MFLQPAPEQQTQASISYTNYEDVSPSLSRAHGNFDFFAEDFFPANETSAVSSNSRQISLGDHNNGTEAELFTEGRFFNPFPINF